MTPTAQFLGIKLTNDNEVFTPNHYYFIKLTSGLSLSLIRRLTTSEVSEKQKAAGVVLRDCNVSVLETEVDGL